MEDFAGFLPRGAFLPESGHEAGLHPAYWLMVKFAAGAEAWPTVHSREPGADSIQRLVMPWARHWRRPSQAARYLTTPPPLSFFILGAGVAEGLRCSLFSQVLLMVPVALQATF